MNRTHRQQDVTPDSHEHGSAAVEFAVVLPVLLLLLAVVVSGARIWHARATVQQLADSTARTVSIARNAGDAEARARALAASDAAASGVRCSGGVVVFINTAGFSVPVGQPASVSSEIVCRVPLSDIVLPGLPGSITVQAAGSSVLDTYRGRR